MKAVGNLLKMETELEARVKYSLQLGDQKIVLNDFLGKEIHLRHNGIINCINCSKQTKTSFSQGFCYNCFQSAPQADESIIRPELSKAQFGIARDLEWSEKHDLIDHFVYLSLTNTVKVGVTRHHQIPTRWIDQGAVKAVILAKTPNRHIAGVIEVFLKDYVADKTNWREMLKGSINTGIDLFAEKERLAVLLPGELQKYVANENEITEITYPLLDTPGKVSSVGFDKTPQISGKLTGIKGQYLMLDNARVLNVRKHNGYYVEFEA